MMQYFKPTEDVLIEFDSSTGVTRTHSLPNVAAELEAALARLVANPENPTDDQLLAWAKTNYSTLNPMPERAALLQAVDRCGFLLDKAAELA